ncbi:sigma-70 family RNA polymerase sigma factor [Streptomyces luteogriseus]|uniref:RNA polymerase sigma factor n=1 Tax=Streptomyces luteogriseus TaxID=68233 RepID=UPI0033FD0E5A
MTPLENMPRCQTLLGSMPEDYVRFHERRTDLYEHFSIADPGPETRQNELTSLSDVLAEHDAYLVLTAPRPREPLQALARVRDVLENTRQAHLTCARDVLENTRQADGDSVSGSVPGRDGESLAVEREDGVAEDVSEDVSAPGAYDPSSFEAFYARNADRCTKYVSSRRERGWWNLAGHSPEDISQDAFETVLLNWDKVSRMDYPYAYLRRVADNRLRRAFGRRPEYCVEEFEDFESWDRTTEHEQGLDAAVVTGEMFRQLVEQLPERQAQVLILYALEYTDSGIGKILGLAPATVRSHRRHLVNYANRTGWKEDGASAAA